MALLDFLKKKEDAEKKKKPVEKKPAVSAEKEPKAAKEPKAVKAATVSAKSGFSYEVVREPHISEKSSLLSANGKYVFVVSGNANKHEIKKSVEGIYGVDVLGVNLIKVPGKKRRLGRIEGFKKGFVKAIVTVKEGQKIEIF
jgi:large subunit ribosomal protein L23